MIKKICIAVIAVGLVVCSLALIFRNISDKSKLAVIYIDGSVCEQIDLSDISICKKYTIKTEHGFNIITIENGRIAVTDSDCPDKICVKTGFISDSGIPIICAPHRLEIVIGDAETDGTVR